MNSVVSLDVESADLIEHVIWDNWPLSGTQIIPTVTQAS